MQVHWSHLAFLHAGDAGLGECWNVLPKCREGSSLERHPEEQAASFRMHVFIKLRNLYMVLVLSRKDTQTWEPKGVSEDLFHQGWDRFQVPKFPLLSL